MRVLLDGEGAILFAEVEVSAANRPNLGPFRREVIITSAFGSSLAQKAVSRLSPVLIREQS
jgi:hypothetical protein